MIDSIETQQIVQAIIKFGFSYLPESITVFFPLVTAIATAITAAVIRRIQLKQIQNFHESELNELKEKLKDYETKV